MMKPKIKLLLLVVMIGLTLAPLASAALVQCGNRGQLECDLLDLVYLIERIINFLLSWAWIVSIFYIMWGGYNMIFAGGDSEAIDKAKDQFKHAIIGFILIMCSYLLINWIIGIFSGGPTLEPGRFNFYRNLLFK